MDGSLRLYDADSEGITDIQWLIWKQNDKGDAVAICNDSGLKCGSAGVCLPGV